MKKQEPQENNAFERYGTSEVSQQIMDSYNSGVIDQGLAQVGAEPADENSAQ